MSKCPLEPDTATTAHLSLQCLMQGYDSPLHVCPAPTFEQETWVPMNDFIWDRRNRVHRFSKLNRLDYLAER